ncbi:MAG: hypothetical protein V4671_32605 [Armatimonadota bacterium]
MTITLDLKPEEESILAAQAEAQGVTVETVLRRVIAQMPAPQEPVPEIPEKNKAAIALLTSWMQEDDDMTDEERKEADRDLEEFKANINRWRAEEGRPPAYR